MQEFFKKSNKYLCILNIFCTFVRKMKTIDGKRPYVR